MEAYASCQVARHGRKARNWANTWRRVQLQLKFFKTYAILDMFEIKNLRT
jgi:hypothetical protein